MLASGGCGGGSTGGQTLPASLVKQIAAVARNTSGTYLGDASVKTAEVYGPASYLTIEKASNRAFASGGSLQGDFYLIVLRGHFVCNCPTPPGGQTPRARIATVVWSPTRKENATEFALARRLPRTMSRLGKATVISVR